MFYLAQKSVSSISLKRTISHLDKKTFELDNLHFSRLEALKMASPSEGMLSSACWRASRLKKYMKILFSYDLIQ